MKNLKFFFSFILRISHFYVSAISYFNCIERKQIKNNFFFKFNFFSYINKPCMFWFFLPPIFKFFGNKISVEEYINSINTDLCNKK